MVCLLLLAALTHRHRHRSAININSQSAIEIRVVSSIWREENQCCWIALRAVWCHDGQTNRINFILLSVHHQCCWMQNKFYPIRLSVTSAAATASSALRSAGCECIFPSIIKPAKLLYVCIQATHYSESQFYNSPIFANT